MSRKNKEKKCQAKLEAAYEAIFSYSKIPMDQELVEQYLKNRSEEDKKVDEELDSKLKQFYPIKSTYDPYRIINNDWKTTQKRLRKTFRKGCKKLERTLQKVDKHLMNKGGKKVWRRRTDLKK